MSSVNQTNVEIANHKIIGSTSKIMAQRNMLRPIAMSHYLHRQYVAMCEDGIFEADFGPKDSCEKKGVHESVTPLLRCPRTENVSKRPAGPSLMC